MRASGQTWKDGICEWTLYMADTHVFISTTSLHVNVSHRYARTCTSCCGEVSHPLRMSQCQGTGGIYQNNSHCAASSREIVTWTFRKTMSLRAKHCAEQGVFPNSSGTGSPWHAGPCLRFLHGRLDARAHCSGQRADISQRKQRAWLLPLALYSLLRIPCLGGPCGPQAGGHLPSIPVCRVEYLSLVSWSWPGSLEGS